MKTVGVVVEYNPLHNGHAYHLQESKRQTGAEAAVAVMSGHFLQRGEPAIVNKWARTEMALRAGVDLVLELPFVFAVRNAEIFSYGAVATLHATGVVDTLCFGSESGKIDWMVKLARHLTVEPESFKDKIRQALDSGVSYPTAYGLAVNDFAASQGLSPGVNVSEPNNILGLGYCVALERLKSPIVPATIQRTKAGYHQSHITDNRIASATALRKLIFEKDLSAIKPYVPGATYDILNRFAVAGHFPMSWDLFFPYLQSMMIANQPDELQFILEITEGLENRIMKTMPHAGSFDSLMDQLKTKRYTWNRLQRVLLYTLFRLTREKTARAGSEPAYIRVLGFTDKGRSLLRKMKDKSSLPVITRIGQVKHPMLDLDIRAGMMYAMGLPEQLREREKLRDYWQAPVQL
ncbi:nucleotidyltransferase [Aneurinibacillus sp. Ricciae_BoGa-3]|uniref:nucleotidyltransferase n=1 Tax=Aneurinibacillus sp. Ricciae_BoGa-3 TaxID=3022697 RepID=UPI00233F8000|nr:nucleotidyltransferase [Aneurinibacillus sp. Ricciae_BoGa-3]WCK53019.1 nucleotidyltransferase [Aneurinibacillus sp. Ricciae_BoGa-3]